MRKRFEPAYDRWKKAAKQGAHTPLWRLEYAYNDENKAIGFRRVDVTPTGQAYLDLKNMGIEILPLVVEQLRRGESDLLPLALELTEQEEWAPSSLPGSHALALRVKWFLDWWEENKQDWLIPWPDAKQAQE